MKMKKNDSNEGKVKKPFYKKIWFWVVVVIVLGIAGSGLGKEDKKASNDTKEVKTEASSSKATNSSKNDTKKESSEKKSEDKSKDNSDLKATYDKINVGDIMNSSEGGSTEDEVKAILGEPASSSTTDIQGISTTTLSWTNVKGGDLLASITVSFSDGKAASKSVSGLKVAKHDKVTADQVNNIATDGSYSEEQARKDLGDPTGITSTNINGEKNDTLIWMKNLDGDLGATVTVSFSNGNAISKSSSGLK
ncbi:hypothetical protein P787_0023 [Enterococcus faecalis MN16]|nr:hypothetical protein P787_0023 [Enterococcus faecalis MN16]KAJ73407.1 hypothetical protein P786_0506 [Enterococcus faecalis MD6]KAJ73880.1 hypothetical protein P784_2686 [Enterococcus faecalis GAN13]